MPSVIATWSGQCSDPNIQENLCSKLKTFAELSHSYFKGYKYFKEYKPIKYFNNAIEGNILIDSTLLDIELTYQNIKKIIHESAEKRDEEAEKLLDKIFGTSTEPKNKIDVFYSLQKINLYGIEFQLFDPREIQEIHDRISFVFLRIDNCPELDGQLVYVEDREECQKYSNEIIKESDWYLAVPRINLRYFCEKWMDRLLGWVKYFYVPNLKYWRYEDLAGYDDFSKFVDQYNMGEFEMEKIRNKVFEILRKELKEEIDAWI